MIINKAVIISIYVLIGIYLLYRLLFKKDRYQQEYNKLYNKILTSDENKVKSQYDK